MIRSAELSDDGVYRYSLTRDWTDEQAFAQRTHCVWVLLNPSTADATVDDQTVRRCISFSRHWGYSSMSIINQFAYRATKPADLLDLKEPIARGPHNLEHWGEELSKADWIMAGWGGFQTNLPYWNLELMAKDYTVAKVHCFGRTANGWPRHPLYLPANAIPIPWKVDP